MNADHHDRRLTRIAHKPTRVTRHPFLRRLRRHITPLSLPLRVLVAAVAGFTLADAHAWDAPALAAPEAARLAGPWATAQALNAERMGLAPLDKTEFILDDVTLKQHRRFAEYSGDISGRWIGAAAFLAPQFPKAFAAFPEVMAGFPPNQKSDGHFGVDQQLPIIERGRDMPILWGNGRLLIGLVEVYDRSSDPARWRWQRGWAITSLPPTRSITRRTTSATSAADTRTALSPATSRASKAWSAWAA